MFTEPSQPVNVYRAITDSKCANSDHGL